MCATCKANMKTGRPLSYDVWDGVVYWPETHHLVIVRWEAVRGLPEHLRDTMNPEVAIITAALGHLLECHPDWPIRTITVTGIVGPCF